jgi:hypothetical protein
MPTTAYRNLCVTSLSLDLAMMPRQSPEQTLGFVNPQTQFSTRYARHLPVALTWINTAKFVAQQ